MGWDKNVCTGLLGFPYKQCSSVKTKLVVTLFSVSSFALAEIKLWVMSFATEVYHEPPVTS